MSDEAKSWENDVRLSAATEIPTGRFAKIKILASSIGLLIRLTASFVAAACDGWLRKQRTIVRKLKEFQTTCSLVLPSSKSSFPSATDQEAYTKWFRKSSKARERNAAELQPEESVRVEILHDPSPALVRADIIFIHGLHGSLFNTWKQGLWAHRKRVRITPLKHEHEPGETAKVKGKSGHEPQEERLSEVGGRDACDGPIRQTDPEYDQLLENITDLLNDIDDKMKGSESGGAPGDLESEPYSPCWPRDWLPKDCPGTRIIAVNYTTDPFLWRPIWVTQRIRSSMRQRSREMEEMLLERGVGRHPIVWVGHSKGGLFVKQMLVDARNSERSRLSALLRQTKGIMFYSVPHRGSSLAHWNLPFLRQSIELTEVKKDCEEVLDLHRKFMKLYEEKSLQAEVFSFVETILTFMWVTNVRVVSVDSADLGIGIFHGVNIDHREICKPLNRECFLYTELTKLIERVV